MSSRRRAQPQTTPSFAQPPQGFPQPQPQGFNPAAGMPSPAATQAPAAPAPAMTLPQIIDLYGKRLNVLETQIKGVGAGGATAAAAPSGPSPAQVHDMIEQRLKAFAAQIPSMIPPIPVAATQPPIMNDEILQEFNGRFEMLAHEINDMKNLVLNLQKYTMEVNRRLLEKAGILDDATVGATFIVPEEGEDDEEADDGGDGEADEGIRIQYSAAAAKN